MSTTSTWALVENLATTTCRGYGQLLHTLGNATTIGFGQFDSVSTAVVYDGVRILLFAVPITAISIFSMFDFLSYASQGTRWCFSMLRLIEALTYLLAGTLDAILTMTLYGTSNQARSNLACLTWMTMDLALVLNSFWIILHFQSHYHYRQGGGGNDEDERSLLKRKSQTSRKGREEWAPTIIDVNWALVAFLLATQEEGTWSAVLFRQLAGLAFLVSILFGPTSERYCRFDADKPWPARSSTVAVYFFQALGGLLLCFSFSTNEAPPIHLLLANAPGSPFFIVLIVFWSLFGIQFLSQLAAAFLLTSAN